MDHPKKAALPIWISIKLVFATGATLCERAVKNFSIKIASPLATSNQTCLRLFIAPKCVKIQNKNTFQSKPRLHLLHLKSNLPQAFYCTKICENSKSKTFPSKPRLHLLHLIKLCKPVLLCFITSLVFNIQCTTYLLSIGKWRHGWQQNLPQCTMR